MVNPTQYLTHEPAPMGIADFGVTGSGPGASGYAYSSPSFQGEAVVNSLSVTITGSSSKVTAFELNAVIQMQRNGSTYSYWIQNGLHLDASSHQFTIGGAYVWNFSSPTAKLAVGEVTGNAGSVLSGDTYYYIPTCGASFPGQCSTLSLPATLLGRIMSSTSGGVPFVAYQYNVGGGWVTYDNVTFAHMAGAVDPGFLVDGFSPTPIASSLYYDAEWVWVGAGGGSASVDHQSDIDMSLDRWNGHNYQAVPAAWDFGSNTGETASNISELATNVSGAEPAAHVASGPGTLGLTYNQSNVGFLNLTVPTLAPGTVSVDGATFPIYGGWVNLTLVAGAHSIYLQNYTNASDQVDVAPGTTTFANLSGAGRVALTETGLPAGTAWGLSVNGANLSTTRATLVLNLPNGTYPVTFNPVPGYYRTVAGPASVVLPGTSQFTIGFAVFTYRVAITESGLPSSSPWWVNLSGTLVNGTGVSVLVSVPNGSTPFEVGAAYEFVATPANGTIRVVAGAASPVDVAFSYRPTFIVGTVSPSGAQVSVGGVVLPLQAGMFNDSVIPGNYTLVATASGYTQKSVTVSATAGNVTWENITLVANQTQSNPPPASASDSGLSVETAVALIAVVLVVVVAILVLVVRRRQR